MRPPARPHAAGGQATAELLAGALAVMLGALGCFQLLAVGRTAAIADGAAEAAAVAVANGHDPGAAARAAAPGWPDARLRVRERAGHVTVSLAPPPVLRSLRTPLRVTAQASVRRHGGGR